MSRYRNYDENYHNKPKGRVADAAGVPESDVRKYIAGNRLPPKEQEIIENITEQRFAPTIKWTFDFYFLIGDVTPYLKYIYNYSALPVLCNLPKNVNWYLVKQYRPRFVFAFNIFLEEFIEYTCPIMLLDCPKKQYAFTEITTSNPELTIALAFKLMYYYDPIYPFQIYA